MKHYNKTLTSFLAVTLGGVGAHRLYLRGIGDRWAWLHLSCLPLSVLLFNLPHPTAVMFSAAPLIISILLGFLQALVLGLTSDEKWDEKYNAGSEKKSDSRWPLALLMVVTFMLGATGMIAAIARMMDLIFTDGAFG
jgi:TM2 domain-containing membrane protein YozV